MINYIFQVLLFQTVFLAAYDLLLKKETFFKWNRAYLILTSVMSYVIPLLNFKSWQKNLPQEYITAMPEIILSPEAFIEGRMAWSFMRAETLKWIFVSGAILFGFFFILKLTKLILLIHTHKKEKYANYSLILLQDDNKAFSFLKYIFIGRTGSKQAIIDHEIVHVEQMHSLDLLYFEIQKIVCWFNPLNYLYQSRITEIHEYLADSGSVAKKDKSTFFNSLLAETFQIDNITFVNTFNNQSLIKKRIIMFNKDNSNKILKFKYLFLVPLLMGMLVYTSCGKNTKDSAPEEVKKEILISAGEATDSVPFSVIEQGPVYPGCEDAEDQKACMIQKLTAHVIQNFDMSVGDKALTEDEDPEKKLENKVYVKFTINKEGDVTDIKSRGPNMELEKEATRVMSSLPKFKPGEVDGKKVAVKFTLPIKLEDNG